MRDKAKRLAGGTRSPSVACPVSLVAQPASTSPGPAPGRSGGSLRMMRGLPHLVKRGHFWYVMTARYGMAIAMGPTPVSAWQDRNERYNPRPV